MRADIGMYMLAMFKGCEKLSSWFVESSSFFFFFNYYYSGRATGKKASRPVYIAGYGYKVSSVLSGLATDGR